MSKDTFSTSVRLPIEVKDQLEYIRSQWKTETFIDFNVTQVIQSLITKEYMRLKEDEGI